MICTGPGGALKPVGRLVQPQRRRSFRLRPHRSIFASELCAPPPTDRRPALTADRPLRIRSFVHPPTLPQIRNRTTTAAPRSALERGRVDCLQSLHSRADPDKYPLLARPQTVMSMTQHRPLGLACHRHRPLHLPCADRLYCVPCCQLETAQQSQPESACRRQTAAPVLQSPARLRYREINRAHRTNDSRRRERIRATMRSRQLRECVAAAAGVLGVEATEAAGTGCFAR